MKRIALSVISLVVLSLCARAAEVPQPTLRLAAANFWNTYRPAETKAVAPHELQAVDLAGMPHLGVFALGDEGFVVLSADDRVRPVLAYSFTDPFPAELHPSLRYWLGGYEAQIAEAVKLGIATPAGVVAQWDTLLACPVPPEPLTLTHIPAMCTTKWDQSGMGDTYNRFCPYDSATDSRTVVGCVATAMAQIMKYWNHPSCGTGSHSYAPITWPGHDTLYGTLSADFAHTTYLWNQMPTSVQPFTASYMVDAVATLSYHCGVAVDMMYGPAASGGSGAYVNAWDSTSPCAEHAFRDYFRYDPAILGRYRHDYDSLSWTDLINTDLEAGHPILYTGDDSTSGHAFVLDGSDLQSRYHFNWGWGGYGDGFFTIDNLAPGAGGAGGNATYTFNYGHSAIFNIFPVPQTFDTVDVVDTICNNYTNYQFYEYNLNPTAGNYQLVHLDTVFNLTLAVINKRYVYLVPNGADGNEVNRVFCPADSTPAPECPFVREGYVFRCWNTKVGGNGTDLYPGDLFKRGGSFTLYAQWVDSATYIADSLGIGPAALQAVSLWPNPTAGRFHADVPDGSVVTVFDAMGRIVATATAVAGRVEIDLSDQPSGLFTLQIRTAGAICNRRIIKQ